MNVLDIDRNRWGDEAHSRATGQTFRVIMEGLAIASEGGICYIIVNNHRMIKWTEYKINDVVRAFFDESFLGYLSLRHIEFPSRGTLKVITKSQYTSLSRCHPGTPIFIDDTHP